MSEIWKKTNCWERNLLSWKFLVLPFSSGDSLFWTHGKLLYYWVKLVWYRGQIFWPKFLQPRWSTELVSNKELNFKRYRPDGTYLKRWKSSEAAWWKLKWCTNQNSKNWLLPACGPEDMQQHPVFWPLLLELSKNPLLHNNHQMDAIENGLQSVVSPWNTRYRSSTTTESVEWN